MGETARQAPRRDAAFVAAMCAWSVSRSGIGLLPSARFYATTFVDALPGVPPRVPLSQWVLWSPLGPIVARLVGIDSKNAFVLLHVGVVIAGLAVLAVCVRAQYGSLAMRVAVVAFVALPVSVALQAWLGSYDAWVFLASTTIVVTQRWPIAAFAGFALALANFDQGVIILLLLTMIAALGVHGSLRRCAGALAGLGAGRLALGVWLRRNGVKYGRLDYSRHRGLHFLLSAAQRNWVLLLLSMLGAGVLLIGCVASGGRRQGIATAAVVLGGIVPMLLATDETRVFALTTWPPLLALLLAETVRDPKRIRRFLVPTIALAAVPGWFVWVGYPHLADYHWLRLFVG